MTDRELLEKIFTEMQDMKQQLIRVEEKVNSIETTVKRNYDLTLEFYGKQQEHNTGLSEKLDHLGARQEIFENQTIKNTADLRRIK